MCTSKAHCWGAGNTKIWCCFVPYHILFPDRSICLCFLVMLYVLSSVGCPFLYLSMSLLFPLKIIAPSSSTDRSFLLCSSLFPPLDRSFLAHLLRYYFPFRSLLPCLSTIAPFKVMFLPPSNRTTTTYTFASVISHMHMPLFCFFIFDLLHLLLSWVFCVDSAP
jgi:hypothetical protein